MSFSSRESKSSGSQEEGTVAGGKGWWSLRDKLLRDFEAQ